MIINSIELYNFRQYKGKQTIQFSTDKERNVTAIIGKNTSGKTTLVQAFNWCLYEKSNFKNSELLNAEIKHDLHPGREAYIHIIIKLTHEGNVYSIKRSKNFRKLNNDSASSSKSKLTLEYIDRSGATQLVPTHQAEKTVQKILPIDLSDYFFFDGERIGEINNKGDIVSAVRALMGLDVVADAKDMFDPNKAASVISLYNKSLDLGSDNKSVELRKRLIGEQENLETYKKRIASNLEEIEYFSRRNEQLTKELTNSMDIKPLQEKKTNIERDIKHLERSVESNRKLVKTQLGFKGHDFFANPLIAKALKVLNSTEMSFEGIPGMRVVSIDHILKRGKCLCGANLEGNEEAIRHIHDERDLLPPQHIGTTINEYKKTCNRT